MDAINREHGRGMIRLASTSPFTLRACRTWHLRSEHCSPRYTTRWNELPVIQAVKLSAKMEIAAADNAATCEVPREGKDPVSNGVPFRVSYQRKS